MMLMGDDIPDALDPAAVIQVTPAEIQAAGSHLHLHASFRRHVEVTKRRRAVICPLKFVALVLAK